MDMMGPTTHQVSLTASKFSLTLTMMKNAFGGIGNIDTGGLVLVITLAPTVDMPTLLMMCDVLMKVIIGEEENLMNT